MREEESRVREIGRRRAVLNLKGFARWLSEADRRVSEWTRAYR